MSNVANQPPAGAVDHPAWCDLSACPINPAGSAGEAHRSRPVTVGAEFGIPVPPVVTASLYQPADYPLVGPLVELEVDRLGVDPESGHGAAMIAADDAAAIGHLLLDLAATAGAVSGPASAGFPRAVLREARDVIDIVGRGGMVPATFAEARRVEDEICAILAVFGPRPGDWAGSDVTGEILTAEYHARQAETSGEAGGEGGDRR